MMTPKLTSIVLVAFICSCWTCSCAFSANSEDNARRPPLSEPRELGRRLSHALETQVITLLDELWNGFDAPVSNSEMERAEHDHAEGRTFGGIKRLQFALLPIMYKMGVMSTLLVALVVISLKGLLIGVILLILNLSSVLAKLQIAKHGWSPHGGGHKDVHVHIHNDNAIPHYEHHPPFDHYSRREGLGKYYQTSPSEPYMGYYSTGSGYASPYEKEDKDPGVIETFIDSFTPFGTKSIPLRNEVR